MPPRKMALNKFSKGRNGSAMPRSMDDIWPSGKPGHCQLVIKVSLVQKTYLEVHEEHDYAEVDKGMGRRDEIGLLIENEDD